MLFERGWWAYSGETGSCVRRQSTVPFDTTVALQRGRDLKIKVNLSEISTDMFAQSNVQASDTHRLQKPHTNKIPGTIRIEVKNRQDILTTH